MDNETLNMTAIMLQVGITIIGSGALFSFIQFLISRKDKQKEDAKEEKLTNLEKKVDDGFEKAEERSEKYYSNHTESIVKLNEAILKLTDNDSKITEYMENLSKELMGLTHDRLIHLTDLYQARGAITLREKANLDAIYNPYHDGLGGNGDGKMGYEHAMKLPVVSDSEAKELDNAIMRNRLMLKDK